MAGLDLLIANDLRHLIYYFLDNDLLSNALFFATRLQAHEPSADAAHILSLCYLKLHQFDAAAKYSELFGKTGQHLGCTYVFAQCCLGLGRFKNGIQALEQSKSAWRKTDNWGKHSEINRRTLPDAPSIYCLLGKLYEGYNDVKAAVESYSEALKLNPFMWDAFTNLCNTGVVLRTSNIFKPSSNLLAPAPEPSPRGSSSSNIPDMSFRGIPGNNRPIQTRTKTLLKTDPFTTSTRHNLQFDTEELKHFPGYIKFPHILPPKDTINSGGGTESKISGGANIASIAQVPRLRTARDDRSGMSAYTIPKTPKSSKRTSRTLGMEAIGEQTQQTLTRKGRDPQSIEGERASGSPPGDSRSFALAVGHKKSTSGQFADRPRQEFSSDTVGARRSLRLMGQVPPSDMSNTRKKGNDRQFRIPKAPSLKRPAKSSTLIAIQVESSTTGARDFESCPESVGVLPSANFSMPSEPLSLTSERYEAIHSLLGLLKKFGEGYYLLTHFKCQKALQLFESIPSSQRQTAWVLSQMGRAHFERADYAAAARTFEKVRASTPLCTEDMDIYSTSLWHLKREVDLAFLSYELVEFDRLSPQTWCAIGNSFSLQRDHQNAIKCFRRATQLDPKFAYAFTLEGHEHVSNEEYDEAIHAFRKGTAAQQRHYNAWYGLGIAHQKLGKFDLAETYFRIASKLNPANAVLIGCIGMALEGRKELKLALQYYTRASELSPDSVLPRERKADILLDLNDLHGASLELSILRDLAPQKASVYILLGRMHSLANEKGKAIHNLTVALALCPQSHFIKSEIESLENEEEL